MSSFRIARTFRTASCLAVLAVFGWAQTGQPRKEAYLDIGSGTTKLILLEYGKDSRVPSVRIIRQPIIFRKQLTPEGKFPRELELQGLAVLSDFAATARRAGAELMAGGATSVFRIAEPSYVKSLLSAWSEKTGWRIKVLTPEEEAHAGYRAIALLHPEWKDAVGLDMGGGSLQLMKMDGEKFVWRSFPWGAVDVKTFLAAGGRSSDIHTAVRSLRQEILKSPEAALWASSGHRPLVAIGGVAYGLDKALAPKDRRLTRQALQRFAEGLASLSPAEIRKKHPSTGPFADEMWSNAVAFLTWMQILGVEESTFLELEAGVGLAAVTTPRIR
jgi:exopolyphosphatase/pppGpp-phosphohydrolase